MTYFFIGLIGYLLGCSNLALVLAKRNKVDFRSKGSGNLGASNAAVLLGWKAGILVALHDIGKAVLAVFLAEALFPALPYAGAVAGVSSVLGHIFPFYLRFRGGKGFASFLGMTLALHWKLALVLVLVVLLVTLITDYIVAGTVTTILTVPTYLGLTEHNLVLALILGVATLVILWKHRENFSRILHGTEIGVRNTIQGKNQVK